MLVLTLIRIKNRQIQNSYSRYTSAKWKIIAKSLMKKKPFYERLTIVEYTISVMLPCSLNGINFMHWTLLFIPDHDSTFRIHKQNKNRKTHLPRSQCTYILHRHTLRHYIPTQNTYCKYTRGWWGGDSMRGVADISRKQMEWESLYRLRSLCSMVYNNRTFSTSKCVYECETLVHRFFLSLFSRHFSDLF